MPLKRKLSVAYLCECWNAGQTITASQVLLLFDLGRVSSSSDKQDRAAGSNALDCFFVLQNFESWPDGEKQFSALT